MTLSGGQRRRLALARVLLAEPAISLLDDCASALDAELLIGRVCPIVSHFLSSTCNAGRIPILDAE